MRTSGIQGTPATTEMPATAGRQAKTLKQAVLRIRDVYPSSQIRIFSIPDPGSEFFPFRIPDPGKDSRIRIRKKNLSILTQKIVSELSESEET